MKMPKVEIFSSSEHFFLVATPAYRKLMDGLLRRQPEEMGPSKKG